MAGKRLKLTKKKNTRKHKMHRSGNMLHLEILELKLKGSNVRNTYSHPGHFQRTHFIIQCIEETNFANVCVYCIYLNANDYCLSEWSGVF